MITLFHNMIHEEMEVYVDDMIVKSGDNNHLQKLQKYELKLNPSNCTFGVASGKLLGCIVSRRGIEVDPAKIWAILGMPPPRTEKEV